MTQNNLLQTANKKFDKVNYELEIEIQNHQVSSKKVVELEAIAKVAEQRLKKVFCNHNRFA